MSATAPTLRPYQRDAIEAVLGARRGGVRRMVVCLPTGAGKTVIFSLDGRCSCSRTGRSSSRRHARRSNER